MAENEKKITKIHASIDYLTMNVTSYIVMFLKNQMYLFRNGWREKKSTWIENLTKDVVEVETLGLNGSW